MSDLSRRAVFAIAFFVFLAAFVVYLITLTPSVPFWDSGEFIAVSYILGIPHPPGTPFYVMLGRLATLVPIESIAWRVNALSALSSALAVMLTYLVGLKFIRLAQDGRREGPRTLSEEWIAHVGAVVGALMLAWSDCFWENSLEAEVYQMMSLAQVLVLWLGLRWWEQHERKPTAGPLLLAVYVMWVSVGLHLGVGIMGLPLFLLVWLVDRRTALVFMMPFLSVLLVTMGLERMAGGVLLLGTITFMVYAYQGKLNGWVAVVSAAAAAFGMWVAFGDVDYTVRTALLSAAAIGVPLALLARRQREGRILALSLLLMVAGYSTHVYLPIRAVQNPAINEGDPSTWHSLKDLLERKQYGQMNMFHRRASWEAQLNKEFWRYFSRQWPILPGRPPWPSMLPLAIGLLGGIWQLRQERKSALYLWCFLGLSTAGLIVFLNFTDHEVRDRDYFFQSGYHAYAMWMGLGVAWLIAWVRDSFVPGRSRQWATGTAAVLLAAQPFLLLSNLWFEHDRRGNYVARDYAYNMLAPLAPNSFVFTNGDNDTFPLWYIQEVEHFRKDVRVVNLSLLNTDWYIRQLRDQEPKVPISLNDEQVRILGGGAIQDTAGNVIYTNEFMVHHILQTDLDKSGHWKKQPYFAVTVPDHMGLDKQFTLEALVYRVNPDTLGQELDVEATRKALYHTFKYRGLFTADGSWDSTVYKDENSATLSRNYMSAHVQLALYYRRHGDMKDAVAEMERASRMFPDYYQIQIPLGGFYLDEGDTAKAAKLYADLAERVPDNPEVRYYHGLTMAFTGQLDRGVEEFDAAIRLDPEFNQAYYAAYYLLWQSGQRQRAVGYLQRWVDGHPSDLQAKLLLESQRRAAGLPPESARGAPLPRPPLPSLP